MPKDQSPVFILFKPQMGENIGAVARAMSNFGLTDLRIVTPRDGWPNSAALAMAAGGASIIEAATIHETLADACHDITHLYATTARERALGKPVYTPAELFQTIPPPRGGRLGGGQVGQDLSNHILTYPLEYILDNARELRKNLTDAEQLMWYNLRRKNLGAKFRRQHPIGSYIVDFVSLEHKLIIELDGGQHNHDDMMKKDWKRTDFLESQGYKMLRFWNHEVMQNLSEVLEKIYHTLHSTNGPLPSPPPLGEGTCKAAILFGPERAGLSNEEIVLADAVVTIPVSAENPSLNLAQASVVMAYEWFKTTPSPVGGGLGRGRGESEPSHAPHLTSPLQGEENINFATKAELDGLFTHMRPLLDDINYFREPNKTENMWLHLRHIFTRMQPTNQEVRTLRGLIRALQRRL